MVSDFLPASIELDGSIEYGWVFFKNMALALVEDWVLISFQRLHVITRNSPLK